MTGFAICETCGQVVEFTDPVVTERLAAWEAASGFATSKTVIELRGVCGACQAKAS
jgi:Fur family zinc uptake transcriptional regulator